MVGALCVQVVMRFEKELKKGKKQRERLARKTDPRNKDSRSTRHSDSKQTKIPWIEDEETIWI